ncbi:phage tail protein, partial [Escherichia coli]
DKLPYFTGADRAALTALTSVGRAILGKTSTQGVLDYLGLGEGSALPVGVPVPWPSATPPTGWLKCNGAAFSSEKYPYLAKVYPTNKLPDLRGEFIRGWDDGRGVDSGRTILSVQGDALQDHGHKAIRLRYIGADRGNVAIPDGSAEFTGDSDLINKISDRAFNGGVPRVSGETRPRNIAFNYIVRAA